MNILIGVLTFIHVLVAVFVIVLVLMQKSSEQGIGAAFGGGMTETVFGAGTTTALVRMTIWCACALLATTLILAVLHSHRGKTSGGSLMQRSSATLPFAPVSQPAAPAAPQSLPLSPTTTETPAAPSSQPAEKPADTPAPAKAP